MRAALAALLLLALSYAGAAAQGKETSELARSLALLQARDKQLLDVGWRLASTNAAFCEHVQPSVGLLLQDVAGYGRDAPEIRKLLHVDGDIAVEAVANGSPAQAVGLAANGTLLSLGDTDFTALPAPQGPGWERLTQLHDAIDATLASDGRIAIAWQDSAGTRREAILAAVPACASRFEVLDSSHKALSDGQRVIFGRDFPGFAYDEPEFAAAVAHELAHNVLGHQHWLKKHGRGQRNVRLTEREADRLMPWLLANAGYPPGAALAFMRRWGPAHDGGILRKRTHEGWDERAEAIAAEIEAMQPYVDANGGADWAQHFIRETKD